MESWSHQVEPEALTHVGLMKHSRYGGNEHPLFVGGDVVTWIYSAIVEFHVREGEFFGISTRAMVSTNEEST